MFLKDVSTWGEEEKRSLQRFDSIFHNNGFDPVEKKSISMKDAMALPNAAFMIPRVLTTMVQEGHEPLLIGANLLQRIDYVPGMQTVFPAIDVLTAREVGDGMALPTFNINVGGGQTFGVTVKRHGLAIRIDKRFVEQSTYPWLSWWMKLAGQALARHKEEYIFSFITGLGTLMFDNSTTARTTGANPQPVKGHTTGRNVKGQFNGSMTMDDVFDMYAQTLMQGFVPDTLLVHPMTWLMWVKDPVMREFAIMSGGGSFFANWTGNAAAQAFMGQYNYRGLGPGLGQTGQYTNGTLTGGQTSTAAGLPQTQTSAPQLPNYLGMTFKILVSPFMRFDPVNKLTDALLFDSKNLGALIVDSDPHVTEWDEQLYNIRNIGIEESYGFGILNEGQAIGVAKNIKVVPNEWNPVVRPVVDLNGLTTYEDTSGMFGASPTNVLD